MTTNDKWIMKTYANRHAAAEVRVNKADAAVYKRERELAEAKRVQGDAMAALNELEEEYRRAKSRLGL